MKTGLGTELRVRAEEMAAEVNASSFMEKLRGGGMSRERYGGWIASLYPIVFGFCGALCRTFPKLDVVREASLIHGLARQLNEEIGHNNLWRTMLTSYRIDHAELYVDYLVGNTSAFPAEIIELAKWMESLSVEPNPFWWLTSQAGIEMMLLPVVTQSIYPGVMRSAHISPTSENTAWWREHSANENSAEATHIKLAQRGLDKREFEDEQFDAFVKSTETTIRLLADSVLGR